MRLGTGANGEFTFLDTIAIVSFLIGLENLDMNITEADVQREAKKLDERLHEAVKDIHSHLSVQDAKLNIIMEALNEKSRKDDL